MKKLITAIIIVASIAIVLAAVGLALLWNYARQDVVPDDVRAGTIAIGGMPIDDAIALLEAYEQALLSRSITITANTASGDSQTWTVAELGYSAEFANVRQAILQLREGDIWERAKYRYHFPLVYTLTQDWNREAFEALLRKQWGWVEHNEPRDATRTITDNDDVVYEPHSDAYRLELSALLEQTGDWVVLQDEKAGNPLTEEGKSFVADLPIKAIHPDVTLEQLMEEGIEQMIVSFSTDFATSAEGRAHNITVTAETLNDWHLAPGETFAYSELIKLVEEKHQYREAPVILNGRLTPGIGGGICQVTSTLYQAVLHTGLEIVERRNHSLPVAYLPLGHDATYATGAIDFQFRNSTGKHLIIRTVVQDRKLTVKLFGTMQDNIRYEIDSVTTDTLAPKTQQTVNAALPVGKTVIVEHGKPGYIVETFRTMIKDGNIVSRDRISRDTYRAQPTIIETGPASLSATPSPSATPTAPPLLEDGV